MATIFSHVNLISKNWRKLADFYIAVFECREKPPIRDLKGEWVDCLTAMRRVRIEGIHLLLPSSEDDGPTLEIFQYNENIATEVKPLNKEGFGHIAFKVDDVHKSVEKLLEHGGALLSEIVEAEVEGAGFISVVYARDPEGNIIEIQKWS